MKFVCSNCSTQYLISDDKVGSQGVKVRCKRCGNVIIVRPPSSDDIGEDPLATDPGLSDDRSDEQSFPQGAEDGDEVGQAFDQLLSGGLGSDEDDDENDDDERATEVFNLNNLRKSEQSFDDRDKIDQVFADAESTELPKDSFSSDEKAQWYVAIGDEQVGPISKAEIEARCKAGEVDGKTLSWCPGMDNWLALQEVEALRDIFELVEVDGDTRDKTDVDSPMSGEMESQAQEDHDEGEQWAPYQGSELASLVEEEMAAVASSPPPEEDDEGDILGGVADDDEEIPPWEQEEPQSGVVAKPNDSFFDSTLDSSSGGDTGGYGRTGVLAGPAYLGPPSSRSSKGKWLLIGVLGGIVLVGGAVGTYLMTRPAEKKQIDQQPVVPPNISSRDVRNTKGTSIKAATSSPANSTESAATKKDDGKKKDQKDNKKEKEKKSEQMVVVKPTTDTKKPSVKKHKQPAKKNRGKKRKKSNKGSIARNTGSSKASTKDSSSTGSASVDSSLPKKLTRAQIGKTMLEYVQSMRTCVQDQHKRDPTVTGVMRVSFTIQPNGRVKGIKVLTKEHDGTYVAGCISYIIRSIHFPKAQGPSKVPMLPLKLGG